MAREAAVQQTQKIESKSAPIGGINARDDIALMPEGDAVDLVNWIPDTYGVRCRKGFKEWAVNIPDDAPVYSILSWIGQDTPIPGGAFLTDPTAMPGKLFAATDDAIYDITDRTAAPPVAEALSGNEFAGWLSSSMFKNLANSYLLVCSEADGYKHFNGTTWVTPAEGTAPGEVNNVNPADLVFLTVWKRRVWFVERESTVAWYLPTDQIAGNATAFDFGQLFKNGGHLAYLANWTIDAGEGVDDFFVAVSSNGDVAVYKGTDPASATTFALVGTFFVGQVPTGRRGFSQYGGDLVLLSANGIFPMSYVTRGGTGFLQASGEEYSSKIRTPLGADVAASFTLRGWQLSLHPSERLLMCSVPDYGGYRTRQYAMSTMMNKWTKFVNIPTLCYGVSSNYMFAGTDDGRVLLLFSGFFDNVPYDGSPGDGVRGVIQPAFSFLNTPALNKIVQMVRPTFLAVDKPGVTVEIATNFNTTAPAGAPNAVTPGGALWDVAAWDEAMWGGARVSYSEWYGAVGVGFSIAANLVTECVADTVLVSLDYMYVSGGPL